jgi:hypothetical protein
MMNHDSKRPVTLEDILRLKRAERPPAEFWAAFDRELRAKQLAAIVEKRPWWRTISLTGVFAGMRRYHLPLGATAVLAVTVLSVREYRAPKSSTVLAVIPSQTIAPESASIAGPAVAVPLRSEVSAVASTTEISSTDASLANPPASSSEQFVLSSEATPSGDLAQMIPLVGTAANSDGTATSSVPSARLITDNFAMAQCDESPLSRQLLSPARGFEARALPARNRPVEPLAQMKVPSGSRRSNLIASATLASTTGPVLASERSARGLSDERLYDTVSRVNARGAGVLVKF